MEDLGYLKVTLIFSVIGLLISVYLLYLHYQLLLTSGNYEDMITKICSSVGSSCPMLDSNKYSEIFGVPVALFGVGGFAFSAVISLTGILRNYPESLYHLLLLSSLGIAVSLYLSFLQIFYVKAECILCISAYLLNLLIFATALIRLKFQNFISRIFH